MLVAENDHGDVSPGCELVIHGSEEFRFGGQFFGFAHHNEVVSFRLLGDRVTDIIPNLNRYLDHVLCKPGFDECRAHTFERFFRRVNLGRFGDDVVQF